MTSVSSKQQQQAQDVEEIKKQGNECIKAGKHAEAILHYAQAIKMDPKNHFLYSNRSLAFLKVGQLYYALQDAKEAIRLQPRWAKGYFRKGETEFQAQNYQDALFSYRQAMIMEPEDESIRSSIRKAEKELNKQRKVYARMPYIGIGIGLFVGLIIVFSDAFLTKEPTVKYLVLRIILSGVFGVIGYGTSIAYRYYIKEQRVALLQPPLDLLAEMNGQPSNSDNTNNTNRKDQDDKNSDKFTTRRKGGTSTGRFRFKKGKS